MPTTATQLAYLFEDYARATTNEATNKAYEAFHAAWENASPVTKAAYFLAAPIITRHRT